MKNICFMQVLFWYSLENFRFIWRCSVTARNMHARREKPWIAGKQCPTCYLHLINMHQMQREKLLDRNFMLWDEQCCITCFVSYPHKLQHVNENICKIKLFL